MVDPYAGAPDWAKPKPGENLTPHVETAPVEVAPVEAAPEDAAPVDAEVIDVWGKTTPARPAQWNITDSTNTTDTTGTTSANAPKEKISSQTGSGATIQKLCWAWV